jgi:hypothetical protein
MKTTTTSETIHVTRVSSSGDVYGHTVEHCDPCGCNGTEHYWPTLRGSVSPDDGGCKRGDVVEEHEDFGRRFENATCDDSPDEI